MWAGNFNAASSTLDNAHTEFFCVFFQSRSFRPTPEGKDPARDQYISVWPVLSSEPKAQALWRSVKDHWTWRFFWACPKKGAKRTHHIWTALWFAVEQHLYQEWKWKASETAVPHEANYAGSCCIKEWCAQAYLKPISRFPRLPSLISLFPRLPSFILSCNKRFVCWRESTMNASKSTWQTDCSNVLIQESRASANAWWFVMLDVCGDSIMPDRTIAGDSEVC